GRALRSLPSEAGETLAARRAAAPSSVARRAVTHRTGPAENVRARSDVLPGGPGPGGDPDQPAAPPGAEPARTPAAPSTCAAAQRGRYRRGRPSAVARGGHR